MSAESTWIDVHTHLNMLETTPEETLRLAELNGVRQVVTIGTCAADHPIVFELARKFFPRVTCTLGVHPHDGGDYNQTTEDWMVQHLPDPKVIAVGEIGLDYYYKNSPIEEQKKAFHRQLEIAQQLRMPVEIHTRDAESDTVDILKPFVGSVQGIFHCFTGTEWLAKKALDMGFNLSISGVVTFKNADALREVVRQTPVDRLHVETDAPFLSPVPHRGKKNTPAFVVHTAELVAQLKGISLENLAEQTTRNAYELFAKLPRLN